MEDHASDETDLPSGWRWEPLSALCEDIVTVTPSSAFRDRATFAYVDLGAIANQKIQSPQHLAPSAAPSRARKRIKKGDTLFSCVRVYLENTAMVPAELDGEICSTAFAVLRPRKGVDPRYLFWLVRRASFIKDMTALQRGNSPPALLERDLLAALVPVAPGHQQAHIADRIEEVFGEIEAGEQELAAAKVDLQRYRRAVLKAAVTGELTRDWREQNPPNETGADLLARILKERRARWEEAERAKFAAKGQTPKNDAWKSRYPEPVAPNTDDLPKLPDGWVWATMAQVTLLTGGLTVDAKREGDELVEVPYLRVANVQRGALDLSVMKTIRAPQDRINALRLLSNDVLLNEGGDRDKVGRGWVWEGQIPDCIHQNHVFRSRPILPELDGRFISHYCNEVGREYFLRESKQTTNLASLSMSKVASLTIPIPPPAEISAIVSVAAHALESCEELLGAVGGSTHEATSLRQSILAAAFSGKLVAEVASTTKTKRRHIA